MDIHRVRYFQVFAECGTLLKASEVLGISQPALSKALRLLETEVNLKLLEPEGRGLRLTNIGKEFQIQSGPLLRQWMDLPRSIETTSVRPLRLGSFEVFTTYFLKRLAPAIELESLEIHELTPGLLEEAICKDQVDFGITYNPVPRNGLDFIECGKIQMGVFGLPKFLAGKWEQFPFVIPINPGRGTPSKVMGLDGWPDHRFNRVINFRVGMMESALELLRQGRCVGYFPKFIIDAHNENVKKQFQLIELDCPLLIRERKQSVYLLQRQGTQESKIYRGIAKVIRQLT